MTEHEKVRVAVIGAGAIAGFHVDVLTRNKSAEVAALCDVRSEQAAKLAGRFGVKRTCGDYRELLKDPAIDAAVVALPVYLHAPVTLDFLKAGKHVLVEKPMASSAADAEAMLAMARQQQRVLTINHNQRFDPDTSYLAKLLATGELGTIHFARCIWTRPYGCLPEPSRNWFNEKAKGGGVLFDLGTHLLDKVLALLGFPEPVQFAASLFTVLGKEQERKTGMKFDAEDLAVGMVQFANGLTIQLELGFGSHIEKALLYFELYGDKGGASTRDGLKLFSAVQEHPMISVPGTPLPAPAVPTVPDDFVEAILKKRAPKVTPESGVAVTRVLEGLRQASERGWGRIRNN